MNTKRFSPRVLAAGGGIVTIALLGGTLLARPGRGRQEEPAAAAASSPVLLVESVQVKAVSLRREDVLSGQIEPRHVATIAAEVNARVLERPVERGDRVAAGGLLARLDQATAKTSLDQALATRAGTTAARQQAQSEYARAVIETTAATQQARAQVNLALAGEQKTRTFTRTQELRQAQAALTQAETDERLAKIEQERYTRLVADGAIAQQTLDRAQTAWEAAAARLTSAEQGVSLAKEGARREDITASRAQVDTARAGLRAAGSRPARLQALRDQIAGLRAQEAQAAAAVWQARITLGKHQINAPFAGRVLSTPAEQGELLAPGTPVARVADIAQVKATFAVPEASRAFVRVGRPLAITADAVPQRTFTGRVTVVGFEADKNVRTFPIEVTLANRDEALLPGMVARLALPVGPARTRLLVPVEAIAADGGASYVFVLENGFARRRDIELGAPSGDSLVQVTRGLRAGEVIARAPQRLTNGAKVKEALR